MKKIKLCAQIGLLIGTSFILACGGGSDTANSSNPNTPVVVNPPPDVSISQQAASKFLIQASFGPTTADIETLSDLGYEAWLNQQFALPITKHLSYVDSLVDIGGREYVAAWLATSTKADDQVRQRVAFALSELWVVSRHGLDFSNNEEAARGLTNYYDILLEHSFGNYRELMTAVTLSPIMGDYLSMRGNQKADSSRNIRPDENYAREMLQLFTIGLHELNLDGTQKLDGSGKAIPTYTQDDIEAIARVFTGWHYASYNIPDTDRDKFNPMKAFEDRHDRGQKEFFSGSIIPAEQSAEQDLEQILDIVFNHPNVGPFVGKQLIQRLVTSNPSNAYVERVASVFNNNGSGVRGDMKSIVKAILLDDEALTGITSSDKIFGKIKEPLIRMVGIWRAFNASASNGEFDYKYFTESLGQGPHLAHHVFNFFSPSYSPRGTFQDNNWVAPEFQIHTEANQTGMTNVFQWLVINRNNKNKTNPDENDILINLDNETNLAADLDALLDHYDMLLFAGEMSSELRTISKAYAETINADQPDRRAWEILGLLVVSPEFMIQD